MAWRPAGPRRRLAGGPLGPHRELARLSPVEVEPALCEQQLNVHGPGLASEPVAQLPVQPGGSDLCFAWAGPVEGAIDHLSAHGVEVELGPVQRRGARGEGTSVYFRDPDGTLLELISYD